LSHCCDAYWPEVRGAGVITLLQQRQHRSRTALKQRAVAPMDRLQHATKDVARHSFASFLGRGDRTSSGHVHDTTSAAASEAAQRRSQMAAGWSARGSQDSIGAHTLTRGHLNGVMSSAHRHRHIVYANVSFHNPSTVLLSRGAVVLVLAGARARCATGGTAELRYCARRRSSPHMLD
jgi:hypothetical protein